MWVLPTISQGHHWLRLHRLLQPLRVPKLLLLQAMSGSVPPNWWGYGMPPEFMAKNSGTSQAADVTGKAPMASAPPGPPMTQNPSILQLLLQDLLLGILKCQCSRCLNGSADLMSMQQRFMTQPGYVNSMMIPNYQSSAGPTLMNVNNGWMLTVLKY